MNQAVIPRCADVNQAVFVLRTVEIEKLRDADWLEACLLPFLGLNDEMIHEFPEGLYPWCGHGLRCWQYPNQFSRYLEHLSTLEIGSYAEIGCRHGGTFIITVEYLKRFGQLRRAAAIDLMDSPILREYASMQEFDYIVASSRSPEVLEYLGSISWDLVLIDGDHSMQGCAHDYRAVRDVAKRIAMHDIASDACDGVVQVWRMFESVVPASRLFTQVQQYEDVWARTGKSFLGLGIVDFS